MKSKFLICLALTGMVVLSGCSHKTHPAGKPLPKLSYEHINPITIHGGSVRIQQSFQPSEENKQAEAQCSFALSDVLRTYASQRFVQNTQPERLVFDIKNAALKKVSDQGNLVGFLSGRAEDLYTLDILIAMTPVRRDGHRAAPFTLTHKQTLALPQNISVAEREFRQFEMMESAVAQLDAKINEMVTTQMTAEYF